VAGVLGKRCTINSFDWMVNGDCFLSWCVAK